MHVLFWHIFIECLLPPRECSKALKDTSAHKEYKMEYKTSRMEAIGKYLQEKTMQRCQTKLGSQKKPLEAHNQKQMVKSPHMYYVLLFLICI
jgi:hypothetical protein